ncbi:3-oxoacyl-ACP synthase [Cognatitamlana onchidii]|uniref:3-oxoacyl-ACP synthase n=1 Tax=Cognatitamlana onchidii TaxID=2562860 RepID=UPI0010A660CB|nr:3-oxoacyl-ACP synthase [Algibacter onchidii]
MNESYKIKDTLKSACIDFVENRLQTAQSTIDDIQVSLTHETKSSAGDKHETGRAMLQLEREKAGLQLAQIQTLNEVLDKIKTEQEFTKVGLGALVYTSNLNYFISISAGELIANTESFYAISLSTPIAKLLLSKQVGDVITFRNTNFTITKIL